jgi:hypothetical protein
VFTRAFASRTRASEPRKGPGYEVERKEQKAKSKKLKSKTQNAKKQKSEKSKEQRAKSKEQSNLVPRAFARFRGSGTGSKGPGNHWSRVSKNIGHFCNPALLKSCHPGGMNN